ncbi:MAG: hypothetical protein PUA78_03625 [Porphyromonadaceae bacterium]|nr:hypothetical protein [Porphyromonadaceae bacterium]
MKKVLYLSAIALTSLIATSCASEEVAPVDNDGMTTLTVKLPDDMASRAFNSGTQAKNLYVAIYEADGDKKCLFSNFGGTTGVNGMEVTNFNGTDLTTTIKVSLVKNKTYDIYCWAQSYTMDTESPYQWNETDKSISVTYPSEMTNYDEGRDAFYGKLTSFQSGVTANHSITLKRPFAQINVGTNDLQAYKYASGNNAPVFGMTVKGAATSVNLDTDAVSGSADAVIATAASSATTFEASVTGLSYLAMGYVLPGEGLMEVDLNVDGDADFATYTSVPSQMNYHTNIYGALLTNPEVFNVEIAPAFAGTMDSAIIEMNNGTVNCVVPKLPAGVTAEQLKGKGGVYIDAQGQPQTFNADGHAIAAAMRESSEIYFAPNAIITTGSHWLVVPQSGVTIHGNGATLTGGEQDFSIQEGANYTQYEEGSTVNITIENLNGVKVWGGPTTNATFNINLKNCTMKGLTNNSDNNMVMVRSQDNATCKVNLNAENCYLEGMKVAFHTTVAGTEVYKNCTFKNVGIPINIAKKLNGALMSISVIGCTFDNCGIAPDDTANSAYNYAAPIRVVDNGGPANAINLLVDGCTFTGTLSQWDLLLMDYREGTPWFPVKYTIRNCTPATPSVRYE